MGIEGVIVLDLVDGGERGLRSIKMEKEEYEKTKKGTKRRVDER